MDWSAGNRASAPGDRYKYTARMSAPVSHAVPGAREAQNQRARRFRHRLKASARNATTNPISDHPGSEMPKIGG